LRGGTAIGSQIRVGSEQDRALAQIASGLSQLPFNLVPTLREIHQHPALPAQRLDVIPGRSEAHRPL
jgi:hypothetical protein